MGLFLSQSLFFVQNVLKPLGVFCNNQTESRLKDIITREPFITNCYSVVVGVFQFLSSWFLSFLAMEVSGIVKYTETTPILIIAFLPVKIWWHLKNYWCFEQILWSNNAVSASLLSIVSTKEVAEVALILNEAMFMVSVITVYFQ